MTVKELAKLRKKAEKEGVFELAQKIHRDIHKKLISG
jgi:hypothetical protein